MADDLSYQKLREDKGYYEPEVSLHGEADLHQHYNGCPKHPGHRDFIPVKNFSMTHLPRDYQDSRIVNAVKAMAPLTVRVITRYTSEERPDKWPDSDEPYPLSNSKGSDYLRTGTGWAQWTWKFSNKPCFCQECQSSGTPQMQWGMVKVDTATHVVFNLEEARYTTVEFFYDSEEDRQNGSIASLSGAVYGDFSVKGDRCCLVYAVHDMSLLEKLEAMCSASYRSQQELRKKYAPLCMHPHAFFSTSFALYFLLAAASWVLYPCLGALAHMVPFVGVCLELAALQLLTISRVKLCNVQCTPTLLVKELFCEVLRIISAKAPSLLKKCCTLTTVIYLSLRATAPVSPSGMRGLTELLFYMLYAECSVSILWVIYALFTYETKRFIRMSAFPDIPKPLMRAVHWLHSCSRPPEDFTRKRLTVIVSHPHGCSKMVTVGEWKHLARGKYSGKIGETHCYIYTTSTCPGSSGALVYTLGHQTHYTLLVTHHVHSKSCVEKGLNMSGGGFNWWIM